jgi:hypothetical protein
MISTDNEPRPLRTAIQELAAAVVLMAIHDDNPKNSIGPSETYEDYVDGEKLIVDIRESAREFLGSPDSGLFLEAVGVYCEVDWQAVKEGRLRTSAVRPSDARRQ